MALFKRKTRFSVGLDLGDYSVKLVQMEYTSRGYRVLSYGVHQYPLNTFVGGQMKNREAVVVGIKHLVQRCDPQIQEVVISVSGKGVITDRISLQRRKGVDTGQLVRFEAEQRCPFDVEDVTLDYKVLRSDEKSERMDVVLVAAKNELLHDLLAVVLEAELKPMAVDVDAFALYNVWEVNYPGDERQNLVLVNIGAEVTTLVFVHRGFYHSARDLSVAGNTFVKAVKRQMGVSPELIHQALQGKMDPKIDHSTFMFAVNKAGEQLSKDLDLAFSYFKSEAQVEKIDGILLSGGCALISWLPGFLEKRHHIPVETLNPFKTISYSDALKENGLEELAPLLAVPIGLALRQAD
jgi:type IV pilus assembly protein PilM